MHGNVLEWVWDGWDVRYGGLGSPGEPVVDPTGAQPVGEGRVLRSGSWDYIPLDCRSAARTETFPYLRRPNKGLRLARTAPAPAD